MNKCIGPCDREAEIKGMCRAHYGQARKGQELKPLRQVATTEKLCPGCDTVKPKSEYYLRKNGNFQSKCRECMKELSRIRQERIRAALEQYAA
jgi:hypothetical protein